MSLPGARFEALLRGVGTRAAARWTPTRRNGDSERDANELTCSEQPARTDHAASHLDPRRPKGAFSGIQVADRLHAETLSIARRISLRRGA